MSKKLWVRTLEAMITSVEMTQEWGRLKASFCSRALKDAAVLIRE